MAGKSKTTRNPRKRDPNSLTVGVREGEDEAVVVARTTLQPTVQAALSLQEYGKKFGELDLMRLVEALSEQAQSAHDGDLQRAEEMLTAQAHTLDAIFNSLARRAALNMGEYMQACQTYLKLALRAQSQCRATWETLATIKNPPMVGYVKQANIAHGHQQINNEPAPKTNAPRTRETKIPPTQLLEEIDGQRLDTGAPGTAGKVDPQLEAVAAEHRPKDCRR